MSEADISQTLWNRELKLTLPLTIQGDHLFSNKIAELS